MRVLTGKRLHSHHDNYGPDCFDQGEVTCFGGDDTGDNWELQKQALYEP